MVNCGSALDLTLSALADHNRREILERLSAGPMSVSDLAEPLGMSLPGTLKHLRVLESAELTRSFKEGRTRWCEICPEGLDEATVWMAEHRRRWSRVLDRFAQHVADAEPGAR